MSMSRIEDLLEQILDKINGGGNSNTGGDDELIIVNAPKDTDIIKEQLDYFTISNFNVLQFQDNISISNNIISGNVNEFTYANSNYPEYNYFLALGIQVKGTTYDPLTNTYADSNDKEYMLFGAICEKDITFEDIMRGASPFSEIHYANDDIYVAPIPSDSEDGVKMLLVLFEVINGEPDFTNGPKYSKELFLEGIEFIHPTM